MGALPSILLLVPTFFSLPIGFCILLPSMVFLQVTSFKPLLVMAQKLALGLDFSSLLAIPLFTLMGHIMESRGPPKRSIDRMYPLSGGFKGAMGLMTIIRCTIFAALSDSGSTTVAAIGSISILAIIENGYSLKTAAGLTAMAGALGLTIPSSIVMIVYGTTMGVSIAKMFVGGVVPGILITICSAVVNTIRTRKLPLKVNLERHSLEEQPLVTWKALPMLLLPAITPGGIYGGIFTSIESAVVGVVYSFVLALVYHEITVKSLIDSAKKTIETSATICFLIAGASVFCWILSTMQISTKIADFVVPVLGGSQALYWILLLIVFPFIGCLMESLASVVMLAPVLAPIGLAMGIDEIHLGVVFCISLIVGFVVSPFGANLFAVVGTTKQPFGEVVIGVFPFPTASFTAFILCIIFPPAVTFLPSLLPA